MPKPQAQTPSVYTAGFRTLKIKPVVYSQNRSRCWTEGKGSSQELRIHRASLLGYHLYLKLNLHLNVPDVEYQVLQLGLCFWNRTQACRPRGREVRGAGRAACTCRQPQEPTPTRCCFYLQKGRGQGWEVGVKVPSSSNFPGHLLETCPEVLRVLPRSIGRRCGSGSKTPPHPRTR